MAGFWRRVVLETLLILDTVGVAVAVGLWASRGWWQDVSPPEVTVAETWVPMRLGETGMMCWRPLEWAVRHERRGAGTELWQWDAGPGGRLVLMVQPWQPDKDKDKVMDMGLSGASAISPVLRALARRCGFAAGPTITVAGPTLQGDFATFGYWQFGGLRPIAWHGWVFRARDGDLVWTACATAPKQGWQAFSADAWAVLASVRRLGQGGSRGREPATDQPPAEE